MSKTKRVGTLFLSFAMAFSVFTSFTPNVSVKAAESFSGVLESVDEVTADENVVEISFNDGTVKGRITFLENGIFRYNVDPTGEFSEYATPNKKEHTARIQAQPDDSDRYSHPNATVKKVDNAWEIKAGDVTIVFDETAKMSVKANDKVVMEEKDALSVGKKTVQTLKQNVVADTTAQFFGGGTQNGRIVHTGKAINIVNESRWNDGDVSSPNPFYYTTAGYGVLRNTFAPGGYDFGAKEPGTVTTSHNENEFDAYYFVSSENNARNVVQDLLQGYFKVSGNPALLPEYGFYLGHLNAYNRDAWSNEKESAGFGAWNIKGNGAYNEPAGTVRYEDGGTGFEIAEGQTKETLNGTGPKVHTDKVPANVQYSEEFSARAILDEYQDYDMPFGFFLPNDGYGAGYGQNGYNMTGGVNPDGSSSKERLDAVAANVENLKDFADYAKEKGVATGLWTQSNLTPDSNAETPWHILRDFEAEVKAGVTTLKTDVAWVGPGYSFQLNGVKQAYDIVTTVDYDDDRNHTRPNIISLDGWAGSQRYNSVWTGDQTGGSWEYIRFHIPTFIGQSLSGNPNIGSDMDGIWGGKPIIATRDYQWKSFAPQMLDMDGWGSYMKAPYTHGDPYTGISRMYLKLKAQMMPYIYTNAYAAANIETGNGDQGLPMVRAMFLEYPNEDLAYTDASKYQYMWGENLLVAPVYQEIAIDELGNDVRNGIYLPGGEETIWIDYFTGEQYRGGQVLNNFDAPIWKLPVFVKAGGIIPMYEENNSAAMIDKTQRIVEFWPAGNSDFTAIEDDGSFIENNLDTSDKEYGAMDDINYGGHVSTKYVSNVDENGNLIVKAEKSTGSYDGYTPEKDTTFVINATAYDSVKAYNGSTVLKNVEVDSKEAFEKATPKAGEAVVFFDETPAIETYASAEETKIAELVKDVNVSGKLYVKFANTDAQKNEQKVEVSGFENDGKLWANKENKDLSAPTLSEIEDLKKPDSITLEWNTVDGAELYEVEADGVINRVLSGATTFTHTNLVYNTPHSYRVRSVNKDGYSAWSEVLTTKSAEDPWLITPEPVSAEWPGDLYGSRGPENAFNRVFEQGDSGFHSDGYSLNMPLTVDYGKGYLFDKVEYYHRAGGGNGVVREMKVETSLDGVNWTPQANTFVFEKNDEMKTMDLSDPNTGATSIGARYIRFIPIQSVGNMFHASELKVYTVEKGTIGSIDKPFTIGNIVTEGTNEITETTFQQMYQKESSMHKSYLDSRWVGEIQAVYGDINANGMSDVYDYAYAAFKADGGTKKTGKVSGAILLATDKNQVSKGEEFTIEVITVDAKNVNAYGTVINYDPSKVTYVSHEYIGTEAMYTQGMTGNVVYDNGTAYVNHSAVNMGDKKLINGSKVLSTITMKANEDIDLTNKEIIDLTTATMIGPDYSTAIIDSEETPEPPKPAAEIMGVSDFASLTAKSTGPAGDGGSLEDSFDGDFATYTNSNYGDPKQAHPQVYTMEFNEPTSIHKVGVSPRTTKHWSQLGKFEVFISDDGETWTSVGKVEEMNKEAENGLNFVEFDDVVTSFVKIELEPEAENGNCVATGEVQIFRTQGVNVESIEPAEGLANSVYVGYLEDVKAVVKPDNATYNYYTVESSDPSIASIITYADEKGRPVYKVRGVKPGEVTIKLTSAENENIYAEYKLTVLAGVDKAELVETIDKYKGVTGDIYTQESYAEFKAALDHAIEVNDNKDATRKEVDGAISELESAYEALVEVMSDKEVLKDIVTGAEGEYSEGNVPMNAFDGELETYWESPWSGASAVLPKSLTVTLNGIYTLEQIDFFSSAIHNGGITEYTIETSTDGTNWVEVKHDTVDPAKYKEGGAVEVNARFSAINAQYVRLTALQSVGRIPEEDNMYARIAEMNFKGEAFNVEEPVTKEELKELIDSVKDYDKSIYTKESWDYLEAMLAEANEVLANENATQEDVENVKELLQNAIDKLVKKDTTTPSDPTLPGEGGNGSGSDSGNGTDTGDTTNVTGLFLMLIVAGGVIALLNRKRIAELVSKK